MIQNFWDAAFLQNVIDCHDKYVNDHMPPYPPAGVLTFWGGVRNELQNEIEVWIWKTIPAKVGDKRMLYVAVKEFKSYGAYIGALSGKLTTWSGSEIMNYAVGDTNRRYSARNGTYINHYITARDEFGSKWVGVHHDHEDCVLLKKVAKHRPAKVGDRIRATTNYSYSHNHSHTGTVTSVFETKDGDYSYKIDTYWDYVNHWNYNISNLSR